ncbi:SAM-dependent methyltransferase [Actinomadura algeriensis]|uniref:O-methyltransferase involved in polyketide biosynthesis n=1 Tax=Actinomadura algeriensis TaxID=1679523 RepID=A0ABR9JJG8_9ACTN|nr:SAM-dependent methyltransferase [Actinomadura algeriensis]MBE1530668.1 O-methyltransferase involved in polyketide biosynthesis [Actinomadura algeriensis]
MSDTPPSVDLRTDQPHPARVYDFYLGGKDHYGADREFGEKVLGICAPLRPLARANRRFLARSVALLARDHGIRQFLDLGTGLPTSPNLHEVAQGVAPEARVVYVDNDPIVLAHARALLTSRPEGATDYIDSDVVDIDRIMAQAARTIDFDRPVAVSALALFHFLPDPRPAELLAALRDRLAPGSFLTISHVLPALQDVAAAYQGAMGMGTLRDRDEITALFGGFEFLDPGLVDPFDWWPELDPAEQGPTGEIAGLGACGVARKPLG